MTASRPLLATASQPKGWALGLLALAAGCVSNPPEDGLVVEPLAPAQPVARTPPVGFKAPIPDIMRSPHALGIARLSYGLGRLEQESAGPPRLDDDENTQMLRLEFERVEGVFGGGVQATAWFADNLHENSTVGRADTFMGEAFPHVTVRPTAGRYFRMPVRLGPLFHYTDQDFDSPVGGDVLRYSVGGRVEIAPEYDFLTRPGFRLSLFGEAHYGYGWSVLDVRGSAVDDEFDTKWDGFGGSAGLRFRWTEVEAQVAYTQRHMDFETSDAEQGLVLPASDFQFDGVTFSVGVRW